MYAKGMTTGDIESHMRELPLISQEWQDRPLEEVYTVVFIDAIHYHVRNEGRIVKRAVYIVIGIDIMGRKDVLGIVCRLK